MAAVHSADAFVGVTLANETCTDGTDQLLELETRVCLTRRSDRDRKSSVVNASTTFAAICLRLHSTRAAWCRSLLSTPRARSSQAVSLSVHSFGDTIRE